MFNTKFFLFFGYGELGNQIFQYAFFQSYLPKNSVVITSNICEISKFIDLDDKLKFIKLKNRFLKFFCQKFLNKFFIILSKLKIVNSIDTELLEHDGFKYEGKKIVKKKGLLPFTFIFPRYFQNDFFFKKEIIKNLRVKKVHLEKAKNFMKKLPSNVEPTFIHVRTCKRNNEFEKFRIFGKRTDLPDDYFFQGMEWFNNNIDKPFYIIMSDNFKLVKKKFDHFNNKIISDNDIFTDILIISMCKYGVMSNSSVSWWGSYICKNKKKIFAPKYWYGWRSQITHQGYAVPKYAETIDPNIFL